MNHAKACMFGLLWVMVMGVTALSSSLAFAQTLDIPDGDLPKAPERQPVQKPSWAFRGLELSLAGATAFDMTTTANGLGHPTAAYSVDGKLLAHYYAVETGWAKCFGDRNTSAIIAGNVFMNAGVDHLSEHFYPRGGRWRIAAFALLAAKTAINSEAAIHNIRYMQTIDTRVRHATGYGGVIIWRN